LAVATAVGGDRGKGKGRANQWSKRVAREERNLVAPYEAIKRGTQFQIVDTSTSWYIIGVYTAVYVRAIMSLKTAVETGDF